MNVTAEQLEALRRGDPIAVTVAEAETECVLISKVKYEELRRHMDAEEVDPSFFECDELDR